MANTAPWEQASAETTSVPNDFIDRNMAAANGDFVKIYLYLLRHAGAAKRLSDVADALSCTESDVQRALKYWEKEGLLRSDENDDLPALTAPTSAAPKKASAAATQVSAARLRELNGRKEIRDLLYAAEKYRGAPLDMPYMRTLLFFYDELGFPATLVEYLVEYCVERGKNTTPYLRTVGLAWHAEGINTLRAAKAHVKRRRMEVNEAKTKASTGATKNNRFNNFTQRMNDYDQMERELIRAQRRKKQQYGSEQ